MHVGEGVQTTFRVTQTKARLCRLDDSNVVVLLHNRHHDTGHVACQRDADAGERDAEPVELAQHEKSPNHQKTNYEKARREERFDQYLRRAILGRRLLILDEIGYLPLKKDQADLFFQVVAKRYEQGSVILTSNLSFNPANSARSGGSTTSGCPGPVRLLSLEITVLSDYPDLGLLHHSLDERIV